MCALFLGLMGGYLDKCTYIRACSKISFCFCYSLYVYNTKYCL